MCERVKKENSRSKDAFHLSISECLMNANEASTETETNISIEYLSWYMYIVLSNYTLDLICFHRTCVDYIKYVWRSTAQLRRQSVYTKQRIKI